MSNEQPSFGCVLDQTCLLLFEKTFLLTFNVILEQLFKEGL